MNKKPVAAVILAAGSSRRMGRNKLLLPWDDGGCVLDAVLRAVTAAPADDAVLVSGSCREQVEAAARRHGVRCCYNPRHTEGQSTSLIAGLDALSPGMAAMIVLGDQPFTEPGLLARLIEAYQRSDALLLQPKSRAGRVGHPVLFAPSLFPELRQIRGDEGGRSVLRAHLGQTAYVITEDDACWQDVDSPEDYQRLRGKS